MKMKKILLPVLVLALMFTASYSAKAEQVVQAILASVNFEDMEPGLIHGNPAEEYGGMIPCVISCNMVLKPKTQIHLSRMCDSAVSNVKYYFNDSTSDIQKGPDYNNVPIIENDKVVDEVFYPASKQIRNSYIGGTVNYKVSSDFQTKKSTGEKIYKETPAEYHQAVIISSITKEVDLGVATTVSVPTGDQSQPYWVGTSGVFPGFENVMVPWTYDFGYIDDSGISGAFGLFKVKTKNEDIIHLKSGYFGLGDGHIIFGNGTNKTTLNEEKRSIVLAAKKLYIQYNENSGACDSQGGVLIEDGWENLPEEHYSKFVILSDGNISYPPTMNAWIRISAVIELPSESYRPEKRVRVKSRISTYGGFKFGNLKEGDVVKIYSVNGKKVAELNAGTADGFEWLGREGTNNSGDWAKSGIYIYQIKLKDGSKIISGTISFVW